MISRISSTRSKIGRTVELPDEEPRGIDFSHKTIREVLLNFTPPQLWAILAGLLAILLMSFQIGSWSKEVKLQPIITSLEAQIVFLEKTQYDNSVKMIEAQEQLMVKEREFLDRKIAVLLKSIQIEKAKVRNLEKRLLEFQSLQETSMNNKGK